MRPPRAAASLAHAVAPAVTLGVALATALLAVWAGLAPTAALAQADPAQQRVRIAAERTQANTVLADRERACLPQFVVASCREAARNEQRATLTRLRRDEMALDEAERNESAARRREVLAGKAAARQSRSAAADARAAQRVQAPAVSHGNAPAASDASAAPAAPASKQHVPRAAREATRPATARAEDASRRAALEAQNLAAFEARARAAEAHREAVALRTARRLQGRDGDEGAKAARRSAPLPTPAAPAALASRPAP